MRKDSSGDLPQGSCSPMNLHEVPIGNIRNFHNDLELISKGTIVHGIISYPDFDRRSSYGKDGHIKPEWVGFDNAGRRIPHYLSYEGFGNGDKTASDNPVHIPPLRGGSFNRLQEIRLDYIKYNK